MRAQEDYTPLISLALGLTVVILVLFQIYIFREPDRIAGVESHDKAVAESAGQTLFKKNCTLCHGDNGEGTEGRPALNDKQLLDTTSDDTIFSIISSGVPNTEMPAWNQSHGGPLTNEDVHNLVAFLRAWQPTAPDRRDILPIGDLTKGKTLYSNVCAVCHGDQGQGVNQTPALNDPAQLSQFDDAWYRDAITQGLPAKGMPTWGTVLSPQQVSDLIAVLDSWRPSILATPEGTASPVAP
jgi:cbb3-type cytochrome c oxidase subunit III